MENLIYKKIEEIKQGNVIFNEIHNLFEINSVDQNLSYDMFNLDTVNVLEYKKISPTDLREMIILTIPTGRDNLRLELIEAPQSFYNYRTLTSDGINFPITKKMRHYRGVIQNDPDSLVAISFIEDEIMGLIATNEGNLNLVSNSKLGKHLLYNEKDLPRLSNFECKMSYENNVEYDKEILFETSKNSISSGKKSIRIYLETEFDIFQTKGSIGAVENFVLGIFNQVAMLYENENIEITLSDLFIWNTPDPYTANTTAGLLSQFQSHRTFFNGDLGQLLSSRIELGGGLAAGFDGLCNPSLSQRLSVSMIENSYNTVPVFSWTILVITHELGHLFGSRHTHACVWNGNNTAIDGCSGYTEGGCPIPGIPSGGGTIMSYCHIQSVGINFNLGFGSQPGNVIRSKVAAAECLCECVDVIITGPSTICKSGVFTVNNVPSGGTVSSWIANPSSSVKISGSGNTASVTKLGSYGGYVTLQATINTSCGTCTVNKEIVVGSLKPSNPTWVYNFPPKRTTASTNIVPGATSYQWFLNTVLKGTTAEPTFVFDNRDLPCGQIHAIGVKAVTPCGSSEEAYTWASIDCL